MPNSVIIWPGWPVNPVVSRVAFGLYERLCSSLSFVGTNANFTNNVSLFIRPISLIL